MSTIFKTNSGIFNSLQADQVSITGQILISGQPIATESYVTNTIQGGVDYPSQINSISGTLNLATGNINQISGALVDLINDDNEDDAVLRAVSGEVGIISGTLNLATGNIEQISGAVQNLNATSTTFTNSDLETYLGGRLQTHIIPSGSEIFDIGQAQNKIRHLYLSDNSLHIGETKISATEQGEIVFPSGINCSGINISGPIGGVTPNQEKNSIQWDPVENKWVAGDKSSELESNLTTLSGHLYNFYKPENNIISNTSGSFSKLILQNHDTPQSKDSVGLKGEITYDDNYMYICTKDNTWKRLAFGEF